MVADSGKIIFVSIEEFFDDPLRDMDPASDDCGMIPDIVSFSTEDDLTFLAEDEIFDGVVEAAQRGDPVAADAEWSMIPDVFKDNLIEDFSSVRFCTMYIMICNFREITPNFSLVRHVWDSIKIRVGVPVEFIENESDRLLEQMRNETFGFLDATHMKKFLIKNGFASASEDDFFDCVSCESFLNFCRCEFCCFCGLSNPEFPDYEESEFPSQICSCVSEDY